MPFFRHKCAWPIWQQLSNIFFPQSIVTTEKEPPTDRSQRKRSASLQPGYSKASGSLSLLDRDGTFHTQVFDTWSFLTWEKGNFYDSVKTEKAFVYQACYQLSIMSNLSFIPSFSALLFRAFVFESKHDIEHWGSSQKYPSSSSSQQLLCSALLVHTVFG